MSHTALASNVSRPSTTYLLGEALRRPDSVDFQAQLRQIYAMRIRPRCMCVNGGVEMYTSRHADVIALKRLPGTGSRHAASCPSYELPADASGLGRLLGSAIKRDEVSGTSNLRLSFSLSQRPRSRATAVQSSDRPQSIAEGAKRLSMLGLIHYLWDRAELTRWHPLFAERRTWSVVRRRVLLAASHMRAGGQALDERLWLPDHKSTGPSLDVPEGGRRRHAGLRDPRAVELVLGELEDVSQAREGGRLTLRHMSQLPVLLDHNLYGRIMASFAAEFDLWTLDASVRVVVLLAATRDDLGTVHARSLAMTCMTASWLPFSNGHQRTMLQVLEAEQRAFIRSLDYGLPDTERRAPMPVAVLTDVGRDAQPLFIHRPGPKVSVDADPNRWLWDPCTSMPALPGRA